MVRQMNKNILIIGHGQVGKAIKSLEKEANNEVKYLDKDMYLESQNFDVIHICFPYINYKQFVLECENYINKFKSSLIIIHTTVPPETTEKLSTLINYPIVYSPVVGIHPYLKKSLQTFKKFVGCEDMVIGLKAMLHFDSINIPSKYIGKPINAELAKILSTTRYGIDIAYATFINNLCEDFNSDFNKVYTEWTEEYNHGYKKLGKEKFQRPLLTPNKNGIGGHCIVENAELLIDYISPKEGWLQHIFKLGKSKK
jgi:UDP-N-acetyl-D-mannosaminuronate dehydrogenase